MASTPASRRRRRDDESMPQTMKAVAGFLVTLFALVLAAMASTMARATPLDLVPDAVLGKPNFTTPAGGAASATNILLPMGIAEDPVSGELWVTDHVANRVLRFASSRAFANGEAANLVIGQADFTSSSANRGGAVAANTLFLPRGIAVDQARRLYVSDTENHRVLVFARPFANGMNATEVVGQDSFTTSAPNRGTAEPSDRGFRAPHGLALDAEGQLWVADAGNARVLRFGAPLKSFMTASDVLGQPDMLSHAPVLSQTGMGFPVGVNVDQVGNLWVVDRGFHRVTRYPFNDLRTDGSPADRVLCQLNFTTAAVGVTPFNCNFPEAVAVEGNVVYVADAANSRVLRFLGNNAEVWVGQAGPNDQLCNRNAAAPTADTLCNPFALAVDRLGNLLVADGVNGRVLRYDQPRDRLHPFSVGEASPNAMPNDAGDVTVTIRGVRFYGDTTALVNGQPVPTRYLARDRLVATLPAAALAGSGALALGLQTPGALGALPPALALTRYARTAGDRLADRVLGQPDFEMTGSSNSSMGEALVGTTTAANLEGEGQVAIDPASGRVFLSQAYARRVLSWPSHSQFRNGQSADVVIGQPDFFESSDAEVSARSLGQGFNGLAIDPAGRLYVADNARHRVLRFDPPYSTGMAASRVFGQGGSFTSDVKNLGGRSGASLAYPGAIAVDANRLFVADQDNFRILVYENPDADTTADAAIGQPDLGSAIQQAPSATRISSSSKGLAVDGSGRLYFADENASRVLRFSPPFATGMPADLVIGQVNFSGTAPATDPRGLDHPAGLAVDAAANLFVADKRSNRVLRFDAPLTNGKAANGLLGQETFGDFIDSAGRDGLNGPASVAVDAAGNVLVYDQGNSRLLAYDRPFDLSARVNLAVTQTASPAPPVAGRDLVITLTASNAGPAVANEVVLWDILPAGAPIVWAHPGCTVAAAKVVCPVGTLPPGASAQRRIVVRPAAAGRLDNAASVAALEAESAPADNESVLTVTAVAAPPGQPVQRYRLFSPVTLEHLYTTDLNEYNTLGAQVGTWIQEGTIGRVLDNPGAFNGVTATPYYRLYNVLNLQHHWTTDPNEYYTLGLFPQYASEGVDGYILPTQAPFTVPLFRLLYPFAVPVNGLHHWTIDPVEYQALITQFGWVGEGGSGFVLP